MGRFLIGVGSALLLSLSAPNAMADGTKAPAPEPSAASVNHHPRDFVAFDTKRIEFTSKVNNHRYGIDVALPSGPPPPGGYPVIYVFDGDVYFPIFAAATRVNGNAPQVVVVGIGYPHDKAWAEGRIAHFVKALPPEMAEVPPEYVAGGFERDYDMTLPPDQETLDDLAKMGPKHTSADTGGLDDFLKTLETEIKPRVYALARVDKDNQALFGHSLGGLATLEALFTEPGAFRTYIIASPSIWWSHQAVLKKEADFAKQVEAGAISPRILVTAGAKEGTLPNTLPPELEAHRAELSEKVKVMDPAALGCALAKRLQALHGSNGYEVADCAVFAEQDHGIAVLPAVGRAISFAFPH